MTKKKKKPTDIYYTNTISNQIQENYFPHKTALYDNIDY